MASPGTKGPFMPPFLGGLVHQVPGGARMVKRAAILLALLIGTLIVIGLVRGKRYAEWAPVDVVDSREPLQELPIRVAAPENAVEPAATHDAVLDFGSIDRLVVGVDLDFVPRGYAHYEAVLSEDGGAEHFRDAIDPAYFDDGRFMLRLFGSKLRGDEYLLEIEGFDAGGTGRVIAASWFEVVK